MTNDIETDENGEPVYAQDRNTKLNDILHGHPSVDVLVSPEEYRGLYGDDDDGGERRERIDDMARGMIRLASTVDLEDRPGELQATMRPGRIHGQPKIRLRGHILTPYEDPDDDRVKHDVYDLTFGTPYAVEKFCRGFAKGYVEHGRREVRNAFGAVESGEGDA